MSEPTPSLPEFDEDAVARGLVHRLRLDSLLRRFPPRVVWAVFVFINGFVTIAVLAVLALIFQSPFLFPSLGPTAFLFFFTPTETSASPRNALCGHALGIVCGYGAFWLVGLDHAPAALAEKVAIERIFAASLSLAATGALMVLLHVVHPPAASTCLIVSLGIITGFDHLLILELAVAVLTAQAIVINRLAGIDFPLWAGKPR